MKAIQVFQKYAVPLIFTVIFYIFTFILGNRTLCFISSTIGFPCPGCGLSRAYLSFVHGDLIFAFHYHPLFFLPPLLLAVVLFKKYSFFKKLYLSKFFWITSTIMLLGVWILRMVIMFPHKEPMTFNDKAVLPSVVKFVLSLL